MTTTLADFDQYWQNYPLYPSIGQDGEETFSFSLVLFSIICLLGMCGNGLVIWIVVLEERKTVSMIWLLNLSVADFIFTALLPFTITHQALGNHWPFGHFLCKFLPFTNQLTMFASVFTLTAIALDRFISIIFPIWSQNHRTVRLAVAVSSVVWILAVAPSVPFFLIRKDEEEGGGAICFYNEDEYNLSHLILARFALAFLLPFITIAFCYAVITRKVRRRFKRSSDRSCRVTGMVICAFFICWLPFHVLYLVHSTTGQYFATALPLATCLAYANSCINPVLYTFAGRGSYLHIKRRIRLALKNFQAEMSNSGSRSESRLSRAIV
ncbi:C3a anaphylatoxin chemotactic receptor-like [Hypanus sabinus]|uniref:C3a anaphylatoxin chemotactic receptor-like n=1 Tax=Hypanus sabinus TaxID=79690 RepID=UPI0028C5065B|nr:C3a anaphylatoxin chemotactic receptor-like [Hypanus sabinus]XP_059799801.1 C3a anaphylatoxin chemotactic receptor-like [Hypanus sabinus]XP_059799802.1 C3a anaphylatoxin chemotactic receptor-like [Hypanus sabinus]XP_059799803.1 C3a anaphylatoxin chemotactic receptor-like [Hypanus sabinus]XP_059799804.1 C3a anaphylatoxin chemotactic receptor-like [Hypanus sabinus]XP_059799805.1 C3a anaphylatoxin chemotactic receptor-like [Hypanus sabinus]